MEYSTFGSFSRARDCKKCRFLTHIHYLLNEKVLLCEQYRDLTPMFLPFLDDFRCVKLISERPVDKTHCAPPTSDTYPCFLQHARDGFVFGSNFYSSFFFLVKVASLCSGRHCDTQNAVDCIFCGDVFQSRHHFFERLWC